MSRTLETARGGPRDERGYTLMGVMVFVFVIIVAGMAFFTMSSREADGAIYRQESTEAFYLADAAIERARAMFLEDRSWRDGWNDVPLGNGVYTLTAIDTTYAGLTDVVRLLATGEVGRARRSIEVMAQVPPASFGLAIHVVGSADVNGAVCVDGSLHVVGDPDFGPHDVHLQCGRKTDEFALNPPPIFVDPAHFPGATYYDVRGVEISGTYQARIYDGDGYDITTALGDSLVGVVGYNGGQKEFTYDFGSDALIDRYFDTDSGVFRREVGDVAVVVNFGGVPVVSPPGVLGVSNVILDGIHETVRSTIVNTRFTGVTLEQRYDPDFWLGGETVVKQITMEPDIGLALVTADLSQPGSARVDLGTDSVPAFVYVTNDVAGANANFTVTGAITLLGDWNSAGKLSIDYDVGFLDDVPSYLYDTWPGNVSGSLKILSWREF